MRVILLFLALLAIAGCDRQKPEAQQGEAAGTPVAGVKRGVDRSYAGAAAPDAVFQDPGGEDFSIAEFRGVPVLVNLWASWCAPCLKELPTLEKLEGQTGEPPLAVIAVSQDIAPKASVDAFRAEKGISSVAGFHDPKMALSSALGIEVMPTTVLYDAHGREVWRYIGDLDWTGAEATKLLDDVR